MLRKKIMQTTIRNTVRFLLLNDNNELLLMRVESFDIATPTGKRNKRFWCTLGGQIEANEPLHDAALRELYEEAGIKTHEVELGPVVWTNEVDLVIHGKPIHLYQQFIVARTQQHTVSLDNATPEEQDVVKELRWFSLKDIQTSNETIFPTFLTDYLPSVIAGHYPPKPLYLV
ncbi:NUDIX domain-containing protein [bacterium]|nr:MAG: NUDIX domain-containing protein [bacterium]